MSDVVTSDVMNDVFTTPSEGDKENIKKKASLTYTVFKPPACKESKYSCNIALAVYKTIVDVFLLLLQIL